MSISGRLRGLAVACWTTDHYHPCSNPGVGISEGCFVFDFASLPLEVAQPIQPTLCTKVAVKHQLSISLQKLIYAVQIILQFRFLTGYDDGDKHINIFYYIRICHISYNCEVTHIISLIPSNTRLCRWLYYLLNINHIFVEDVPPYSGFTC